MILALAAVGIAGIVGGVVFGPSINQQDEEARASRIAFTEWAEARYNAEVTPEQADLLITREQEVLIPVRGKQTLVTARCGIDGLYYLVSGNSELRIVTGG